MSQKSFKQKTFINQENLLNLLRLGGILFIAFTAPNVLKVVKPLITDEWQEYYPSSISGNVTKLWRKGFVEIKETENGQEVKITNKGQKEVLKFNLSSIEIKTPRHWDGKWRVVFFDISEKRKRLRDFFCRKLKQMNFYLMQDSVLVHPFPCEKEIMFLREVLGIPHEVKIGTIERIDNAEDLKKIFKEILLTS